MPYCFVEVLLFLAVAPLAQRVGRWFKKTCACKKAA